ncbi:MAG: hypothetical protein QME12_08050 [Nanoarchaeota archaeon]|nr:hypothetical protein [Nanoarchaeota archaeon]
MASLSENLDFLFPEKLKLFQDMVQLTFELNTHIYLITDIEKEIYERNIENLSEDRMMLLIESVKSFPVYLIEEVNSDSLSTKNPYEIREILAKNPHLRKLFSLSGSSVELFGQLLSHSSQLNKKAERTEFSPQNEYEESLKGILMYDHFFELFLRESGMLMTDLKFYIDIADRVSCSKDIPSILSKLGELNIAFNENFRPNIPQYKQTQLSCGATCLANVVGTYYPYIKVNNSLEDGIHKLVTVPGFFNNLPSSLAYVSRDKLGIPSHFFAEFSSFGPLFLKQKAAQEPLRKFQGDYEKIKGDALDYAVITTAELKEKLGNGHLISFVCGQSPMLHYKMIVGYKFKESQKYFYVFDPAYGMEKIPETEMLGHMRNDKSLWGVEYVPPESVIFGRTRELLSKAREILSWQP